MTDDFLKLFDSVQQQNISEGVFYTLKKDDLTVYISHFTKEQDMADMDNAKAVVAAYRDHLMILNIGSDIESVLTQVKKIMPVNRLN